MTARPKALTSPLAEIELKAKAYSDDRAHLGELAHDLLQDIEELQRKALPGIKRAVADAAESHAELRALIEMFPGAFEKPRTQIFHGIKVGYRKGGGKVTFENAERVVALIKKHLAENAALLIKTTEKPNKEAIADLDVVDLKRIGCAVEGTGDVVEIRPVDGAVEKQVKALLKDAIDDAEGE